jgi:hypothetical protein
VFTEAQNRVNEVFARTTLSDLLHPKASAAQHAKAGAGAN